MKRLFLVCIAFISIIIVSAQTTYEVQHGDIYQVTKVKTGMRTSVTDSASLKLINRALSEGVTEFVDTITKMKSLPQGFWLGSTKLQKRKVYTENNEVKISSDTITIKEFTNPYVVVGSLVVLASLLFWLLYCVLFAKEKYQKGSLASIVGLIIAGSVILTLLIGNIVAIRTKNPVSSLTTDGVGNSLLGYGILIFLQFIFMALITQLIDRKHMHKK